MLFTHSVKRVLSRLENYFEISRCFLCSQQIGSKTPNVVPWISQTPEISGAVGGTFILMDLVFTYIRFKSSQLSLIMEMSPMTSNTFLSNTFYSPFSVDFSALKATLFIVNDCFNNLA